MRLLTEKKSPFQVSTFRFKSQFNSQKSGPAHFPGRTEGAFASMPPAGQRLCNSRAADAWEAWQSKSEPIPGRSINRPYSIGSHGLGDVYAFPFFLYSHRSIRLRLLILFPNRCGCFKVWRQYACTECNQNASKIVWEKLRDPGESSCTSIVLPQELIDRRGEIRGGKKMTPKRERKFGDDCYETKQIAVGSPLIFIVILGFGTAVAYATHRIEVKSFRFES